MYIYNSSLESRLPQRSSSICFILSHLHPWKGGISTWLDSLKKIAGCTKRARPFRLGVPGVVVLCGSCSTFVAQKWESGDDFPMTGKGPFPHSLLLSCFSNYCTCNYCNYMLFILGCLYIVFQDRLKVATRIGSLNHRPGIVQTVTPTMWWSWVR